MLVLVEHSSYHLETEDIIQSGMWGDNTNGGARDFSRPVFSRLRTTIKCDS